MSLFVASRRISLALAIAGVILSAFLTWLKVTNTSVLCTGVGGCDAVQQSIYSEIAGIPVALLGVVAYLAIAACLVLEERRGSFAEFAPYGVLGLSLVGVLYSIYLTYLELYVILAVCPYCVLSAILIVAIFAIAVYRAMNMPLSDQ